MRTLSGQATARGFALGPAFVYRGEGALSIPEYIIDASEVESEIQRFNRARASAHRDIESLIQTLRQRSGHEDVMIFEGHQMMLEDPLVQSEVEQSIRKEHLNAEAAVRSLADRVRAEFGRMNDPYCRERVRDIDDGERRLQKALGGFGAESVLELVCPCIVVAEDLTPSEIVRLPQEYILGFATNGGSTTSHVALLARAMGIPAVTGLGSMVDEVFAGDTVLLDGSAGVIVVRPDSETEQNFRKRLDRQNALAVEVSRAAPAGTLKAGGEVRLCANVHPGLSLDTLAEHGARGIGLYRTEYLWLNHELEPTEDEQFQAYRVAAESAGRQGQGASAAIRLFDIGGDKAVKGVTPHETNPFLGNRSIRYLLSNRPMLMVQLRAILRASAYGPVKLIVPMVACVEELRETRRALNEARSQLDAEGIAYDATLSVGAMIEVPSAAIIAEAIAREVDFFSIGTNDLIQYTLAADRGNAAVANLYQPLHPAILGLLRGVFKVAKSRQMSVSVCGESASDPVAGLLWAAMGATMLSMSAACIPVISALLSRVTRQDLTAFAAEILNLDCGLTGEETYAHARRWLETNVPDFSTLAS